MAFNEATVAEIVRQQLGDVNSSRRNRVIWAIPRALDRLARKIAANPKKRHLLMTEKNTTTMVLVAGEANLTTGLAPIKLLREYLRYGNIWIAPDLLTEYAYPLQWMDSSQQSAPQTLQSEYYYYWQDGPDLIHVKDLAGVNNTLGGDLFFECVKIPTLAEINVLVELQDDFIEKVIELSAGPESDAAEDEEH